MKIPRSNLGKKSCVQQLFLTFRTIFVRNMFSPCSAKRRGSEKDFPVPELRSYCPNIYTVHPGLTGKNCETDVNECLQNPFPCFKGNCVNKWSTYECNCLSGYFGANCDNFLVQVIFCKNNTRSFD